MQQQRAGPRPAQEGDPPAGDVDLLDPALRAGRDVVDGAVAVDRRPADAVGRRDAPQLAGRLPGVGEVDGAQAVDAAGAGAPHEPALRDRRLLGAGRRDSHERRERVLRGDDELLAVAPDGQPRAERRIGARQSDGRRAGALDEPGPAARKLPGDRPVGAARIGPDGRQQRRRGGDRRRPVQREHERGRRERHGARRADRAQDVGPVAHRRREVDAASGPLQRREDDDRQAATRGEGEPDGGAGRDVAEREAGGRERVDGERQDEGREAEAEQHAVQRRGERDRQHAAPGLGNLPADLRDDPASRGVARGGDEQRGGRQRARGRPAAAERATQRRQPAERRHAPGRRAGRERRAGDRGHAQAPGVAVGRERVDHREAARRPGAGDPRQHRGEDERGQHGTFVWKYMTQNTRRLP